MQLHGPALWRKAVGLTLRAFRVWGGLGFRVLGFQGVEIKFTELGVSMGLGSLGFKGLGVEGVGFIG